jgi:site-specific DNA-methyltransferase (adenine-specific)
VTAWTLHLGDCLDPATGLASLPDKSVDHVICDPPYEAEAHTLQRRVRSVMEGRADVAEVSIPFAPMDEVTREAFAQQAARVARRWVIAFCQAEAVGTWREVLVRAGLAWKRSCIWVKPDPMPQITGDRPGTGYESIACAHQPGRSRWNGGGRPGVFVALKGKDHVHPTQKPEDLMAALVSDFTDPADLICDPFAGSGTTGVAAVRLGRRFVGWERDPKYHAVATRRLEGTREQLSLLERPARKPKQESLL